MPGVGIVEIGCLIGIRGVRTGDPPEAKSSGRCGGDKRNDVEFFMMR